MPELAFSGSATKMVSLLRMNECHIKWDTPWLGREVEMLAFGIGGGLPLIIFPTSFGRYHQNKDFGLVGSVSSFVDVGTLRCTARTQSIWKVLQQINPSGWSHAHS